MGRRTGESAQRLCARGSGAGWVGVDEDKRYPGVAVALEVAPARKEGRRDNAGATEHPPEERRRGLARRQVADLGGARRAGVGVGIVHRVWGCTRMRACVDAVSTTHSAEAVPSLYSVSTYLSAEYPASTYISAKYPVSTFLPTAGRDGDREARRAAHRGTECPKVSETDGRMKSARGTRGHHDRCPRADEVPLRDPRSGGLCILI